MSNKTVFEVESRQADIVVESKILDGDVQLDIQEDYYALSFVCFIKYYAFRYKITRNE